MPPTQGPNIPANMQIMYGAAPPGIDGMPMVPGMGIATAPPEAKEDSFLEVDEEEHQAAGQTLLRRARKAWEALAL